MLIFFLFLLITGVTFFYSSTGPAEPVRLLRPWSDQKSCHLWSKPCIFRVLVGPIIVRLMLSSDGRTNLALLPPPLIYYTEGHIDTWSAMGVQPPPLVTTMGDLPSLLRKIYRLHMCRFDHMKYKSRNGILV